MAAEKPRILVFAGSTRKESLNKKAAAVGAEALRAAGAEVTHIDLADYRMPVYDGDLEDAEGLPESARKLKALMKAHDGFLISTPEYNSSVPGPLKNVLDWASRSEPDEAVLAAYKGKVAALMSASPGALGGLRSLAVLRALLENIGVLIIPEQVALSAAHQAFEENGALKDQRRAAAVKAMAERLVAVCAKLRA